MIMCAISWVIGYLCGAITLIVIAWKYGVANDYHNPNYLGHYGREGEDNAILGKESGE
jgi:hypothetical protein